MAAAGDPIFAAGNEFADLVTVMSEGRLVIENYACGGITPKKKELEGLAKGVVEAIQEPHGWCRDLLPASGVFSATCGGLTGVQAALWYLAGEVTELARQHYEEVGVKYIAPLNWHPAEVWAHSTVPIETVADLQGLKMRAGGEVGQIFDRIGVSSVVLSGGEIYEALQRGVIDACEYVTPRVNWAMGFQEVTDYMYLSPVRMPHDSQSLMVTADAWAELSPDLQAIVETAAWYTALKFFGETLIEDKAAIAKFEDYGTIVQFLNPEIEEVVYEAAAEFYAESSAADPWYAQVYQSKMDWREICEASGVQ